MPLSRSSFMRFLVPGFAALTLFGAGCKQPGGASDGAAGTTGGDKGGTEAATNAVAQDTSGDTIVVGHYASMTGETATFGTQTDAGVKFAVAALNKNGGVLGKKIEIQTEDDRSLADEAITVVTKFASDPKIVAVIGEVASSRSKVAAPVLQRAGIPMISPSSTNPEVTKAGPFIFRVCFIDPFQGYVMAKFAHDDLKVTKVAIMRDQSQDYSVGLADAFTEAFKKMGGTIIADVSYNAKDSDFRPQLGQIKAAEAIFIPGYYGEVGTIARQARESGITAPLMGGDGWDSPELIKGAGGPGKALEGCYFSTHYSTDDKTPRVQEFVKAYSAQNNGVAPASNVAQGYDAMMILADAITRAKSTERAKVRDALAQTKNYKAITGDITIDADRNANKSAVVLQIQGAKFVYKTTVQPENSEPTKTAMANTEAVK